ncbi:LysR family transcriptional regulator [Robbsia sp. KACC 23696]|uniref:LysR family transcriptional regulator n=1 Tax=Robbsia sp. KACC 23696 TaxID=3149231 RepID=UPI00325B2B85
MKTTTEELLAFVTVVDAGSITAAADALAQTVSGVSRALTRLETKLDVTLIRRTTRRLLVTDEGQRFLSHARQILAAIALAEASVGGATDAPTGRLRVDAASPFILHAIVPHVAAFQAQYPHITLELTSHEHIVDLLEHRVDLAIRIGVLQDSSLHARALGHSPIRVLASPAYLDRYGRPQDVAALRDHRLIGFTAPDSLNAWPLPDPDAAEGADSSFHITPNLRASSGETIRHLALAGNGIACLSAFMTDADIGRGDLEVVLADLQQDVRQPIHAVFYQNATMAPRIKAFLDFLASRIDYRWHGVARGPQPASKRQ